LLHHAFNVLQEALQFD